MTNGQSTFLNQFSKAAAHPALVRFSLLLLCFALMPMQGRTQCVADTTRQMCGYTTICWERQQYDTTAPLTLVHVHENETTALEAAQWLLDSLRMGSLSTWRVQGQRYVGFVLGSNTFRFDPNRIYSRAGLLATLGTAATDSAIALVQALADSFLQQTITGKKLVVAVHNNTNGGALSVKSYNSGGVYATDAAAVYVHRGQDADDFFYTTDIRFFNYLKSKGFNVVLQNNSRVANDGSLSVFCAGQSIPYINVETQAGHLQQQKKMLDAVAQLVTAFYRVVFSKN